jgi:O-antigen/teichoic acid export membrane protein
MRSRAFRRTRVVGAHSVMEKKRSIDLSTGKVLSDSFFFSAARVATLIIKPIKGFILPGFLGPRLYGILNIPVPYILNGSMLSNLGYNTSVLKLMPGYLNEGRPDLSRMIYRSTAFCTLVLSSFWCAVLLVFSPWISTHVAHEPDAVNPLRIYALVIPFLAVNLFFAAAYLAVQRGKLGAAISFMYGVLNTLLPIAAVVWRRNVETVIWSVLASEAASAVCYAALFHRRVLSGFGTAVGPLWRGIKETTSFGWPFFLGGLGWNLINSVDRLLIKFYLPAAQLGYYSMATQVHMALGVITSTLGFALVPALTAARDTSERTTFQKLIHNSSRLGFIILVPISIGAIAFSRDLFSLVLPKFVPSVLIVQILVSIGFIDLFERIGWAALVAHGRGGATATTYILAAVWNIALNRILIPPFGIVGAAIAALSTFIFLAVVFLIQMRRVSGAFVSGRSYLQPIALSLIYPVLAYLLSGIGTLPRFLVGVIGGSVLYLLGVLLTGLVRPNDFEKIREMLAPRAAAPHVRLALGVAAVLERVQRVFGRSR